MVEIINLEPDHLHILLVDDDPNLLATVSDIFQLKGFETIPVNLGRAALAQFEHQSIDVALIDLKLEDMSGLEVLRGIKARSPETECILLTGYASQDSAIAAINAGAYSYLQKPCNIDQLVLSIQRATEKRASERKVRRLLEQQLVINQLALALGESLDLQEVFRTVHHYIQNLMEVWCFIISSYDEQDKLIRAVYAAAEEEYDVAGFPTIPLGEPGQGTQSRVIHSGQPLYTPDHQSFVKQSNVRYTIEDDGSIHAEDQAEKDKADTTRSVVYLPMKIKGKVVGIMQIQSRRLNAYSQNDINLLAGIANVASVAIQNARLHAEVLHELAEIKRTEEALQVSEERFRVIFEKANDGIHIANENDQIIDANPRMGAMLGYTRTELLTMHVQDLQAPERKYPGHLLQFEMDRHGHALFEGLDLHRNGRHIPIEISVAPIDLPDGKYYVSIVRDITERKQAESSIQHHLAELEMLHEAGLRINALLEPDAIARQILQTLADKLNWTFSAVFLNNPATHAPELLSVNCPCINDENLQIQTSRMRFLIGEQGEGLNAWVIQNNQSVRSGLVSADTRYVPIFTGMQSGIYIPMCLGERSVGSICVESPQPDAFSENDERLLSTLATQVCVSLENARLFEDLRRSNVDLTLSYDDTIRGWSQAMELRDKEIEGHAERVTTLTVELATRMGIPAAEMDHFRRGALLHDIGKMGVPDAILLKPDKLTPAEWEIMRMHPVYAYDMLSSIEYLRPTLVIPLYHHERWDGTGYPDGLIGEQIPLYARLFAIVDVYDALTADRPYRPAWTKAKAIEHIRNQSGKHFAPDVVEAFLPMVTT